MYGMMYVKEGKPTNVKQKFDSKIQAEEWAKTEGIKDYRIFPLSTQRIDITSKYIDIGK